MGMLDRLWAAPLGLEQVGGRASDTGWRGPVC